MRGEATSDELALGPLLADVVRLQVEARRARIRHPMLDEALHSLERSVEELQVASEELHVKNEELLLALDNLDAERRRYRDLFDLAADGYLVTDAHDVIVEANRAAGELTGRPAESLLGCHLVDLLDPGSRQEASRRARQARAGRQGDAIVDLAVAEATRLVQLRYRRRETTREEESWTHWTLSDLERPVFEAEAATEDDPALARRWLGIYGELVAVTEALLEGAMDRMDELSQEARNDLVTSQVRPLEARLARLRRRRDHWSRRHADLVGLELSQETGRVRYRDRTVEVTRREQQLLRFLVERPGSYYPSRVLLARAWHASYLSEEQVRTYVARLRRKLEELEVPCDLVTRRPHGYALVFR